MQCRQPGRAVEGLAAAEIQVQSRFGPFTMQPKQSETSAAQLTPSCHMQCPQIQTWINNTKCASSYSSQYHAIIVEHAWVVAGVDAAGMSDDLHPPGSGLDCIPTYTQHSAASSIARPEDDCHM